MRVIIVDDEHLARALLREFLGDHPGIEIVAECANGFEAVKAIGELRPDLVFLDIQMPKLDGFEVVELAHSGIAAGTRYVFVTAYDQFALKAFEVRAIDYLLKPFSRERLAQALDTVRSRVPAPEQVQAVVQEAARRNGYLERVLIRDGARVHVVPTPAIDWIEAQDDYVAISAAGKTHLKNGRMAELEEGLDPALFLRVHRSYIVNLGAIARIEAPTKDSWCAVLKDGKRIPVSRSGYAKLKELMR
ncbi:LytTR family DNA-binding domain-containing protein [Massilia sp. YIM B02769]|uniref:LytR/AlgR family response regulator transcription factor n=1 Tax=unclassified Massilia TaxID=2609279 RepID=UPI0025B712BE|nr:MULTISPECIES: LytTR family DNA-binding domain-containing protein [unclassified Massilia]MDN4059957.1 LytTR family DNA-binding domain-containing protein [Massilia sp. YIM B02769]